MFFAVDATFFSWNCKKKSAITFWLIQTKFHWIIFKRKTLLASQIFDDSAKHFSVCTFEISSSILKIIGNAMFISFTSSFCSKYGFEKAHILY